MAGASASREDGHVKLTFARPDHISDAAWEAIQQHVQRVDIAISSDDLPLAIGSAKEVVESVARVVIEAKSLVVGSNEDFDTVVNEAHQALERQPGKDLSMSPDVRAIASSARKMMAAVRNIRNDVGTGHGRGHVDLIDEEKVWTVIDAAGLWSRWALRRLGHLLGREPERLIGELEQHTVYRVSLQQHLEAVVLPQQPPDIQRAIGVAFARRAARGTFVAREVGVQDAETSGDLTVWPEAYRFGVAEGFTLSANGYLHLTSDWAPTVARVLSPIRPDKIVAFLVELSAKVDAAGTDAEVEDLYDAARSMAGHVNDLPAEAHEAWRRLADLVDPTSGTE
jgi:hypothetical protein